MMSRSVVLGAFASTLVLLVILAVGSAGRSVADEGSFDVEQPELSSSQIDRAMATTRQPAPTGELTGLSRSEVSDLVESVFGSQIVAAPEIFYGDENVERYVGNRAALVTEGDDTRLYESSMPLTTGSADGRAPVDLSLTKDGDEFVSKNAPADVSLPTSSEGSVEFGEANITITPELSKRDSRGELMADGSVIYPNVDDQKDLALSPTLSGVETFSILRDSESSPTDRYELSMPDGARLVKEKDGSASVVRGDETLMTVSKPIAYDATLKEVPVSVDIQGDTLVVTAHPKADSAYPILVDPTFEIYVWSSTSGTIGLSSWTSYTPNPTPNPGYILRTNCPGWVWCNTVSGVDKPGLYIDAVPATYPAGAASWNYYVPRYQADVTATGNAPSTYITAATFTSLYHILRTDTNGNPFMALSIYSPSLGVFGDIEASTTNVTNGTVELEATGTTPQLLGQKQLQFAEWFLGARTLAAYRNAYAGAFAVVFDDQESPALSSVTSPSGWMNAAAATAPIGLTATDAGLGVKKFTVTNGGNTWTTNVGCSGLTGDPCPRSWSTGSSNVVSYTPASLSNGVNDLAVTAYDVLNKTSSASTVQAKIDRDGPTITATGTLTKTNRPGGEIYLKIEDTALSSPVYDGSGNLTSTPTASQIRSGAKRVRLYVDNVLKLDESRTCTAAKASCKLEPATTTVDLSGLANGLHEVKVVAEDQAGNTTTQTWNKRIDTVVPNVDIDSIPTGWITGNSFNVGVSGWDDTYGIEKFSIKKGGTEIGSSTLTCSPDCPTEPSATVAVNATSLAEGENTIDIYGIGPANDGGIPEHKTVKVDRVIPSVTSIDFPAWVADKAPIGVEATNPGSGVQKIEVKTGSGTVLGSKTIDCSAGCPTSVDEEFWVDTSSLSAGSQFIYVYVIAPSGLVKNQSRAVSVDHQAPTLDALGGTLPPLSASLLDHGGIYTLTTGASDGSGASSSGLAKVKAAQAFGDSWSHEVVCGSCSALSFDVDLDELDDGEQTIAVVASDVAGNTTKREVAVTLDRSAPEISIDLTNGSPDYASGPTLDFNVSAPDVPYGVGYGLDEVTVSVDEEAVEPEECEEECFGLNFSVPDLDPGTHQIDVEASDLHGNVSEESRTVTIDRSAPSLSLSGDLAAGGTIDNSDESLEVAAVETESTGESGVIAIAAYVDKGEPLVATQECPEGECDLGTEFTLDPSVLPYGQHTITVQASDAVGNTSSEQVEVNRFCPVAPAASISTTSPISTPTAVTTVESNHPDTVAPSGSATVDGVELSPTLEEKGDVLNAEETTVMSQLEEEASGAAVVGNDENAVCIVPAEVSTSAGDATIVNDDSALYANTLQDTDLVVRPTLEGQESFLVLRSEDAPEEISWNVGLPEGASLAYVRRGTEVVATVDASTLQVPEDQPEEFPVLPGAAAAQVAAGKLPAGTTDADPNALPAAIDEATETIEERPADSAVGAALPTTPSSVPTPPTLPDPLNAADAVAAVEASRAEVASEREDLIEDATQVIEDKFEAEEEDADERSEDFADDTLTSATSGTVQVATIATPEAVDANGNEVPLVISGDEDQVTLEVDHQDGSYQYPIAADPYITVQKTVIVWEKYPIYRWENYVTGKEFQLRQVGWWNSKNCKWVVCTPGEKAGWWRVPGGLRVYMPGGMPNGGVGPKYEGFWKPTYAKRKVFDRWGNRAVRKIVEDKVWKDDDGEPEEENENYFDDPAITHYETDVDATTHYASDPELTWAGSAKDKLPDSWMQGMNTVSYWKDDYRYVKELQTGKRLRNRQGMDTEVLVPIWYVDGGHNTYLHPTASSPTKKSIRQAAANARHANLKIVLKPHVINTKNAIDDIDRTKLYYGDKTGQFFSRYFEYIKQYACLAKQIGASGFVLGTELTRMQGNQYKSYWYEAMWYAEHEFDRPGCQPGNALAGKPNPELYYAANWYPINTNFPGTGTPWSPPDWWFDDRMDGIGIDYYPGDYQPGPAEMFGYIKTRIADVRDQYGVKMSDARKIFLSETGAGRYDDPNKNEVPFKSQRYWYEQIFKTAMANQDWFDGIWWWDRYTLPERLTKNSTPVSKRRKWKDIQSIYTPFDGGPGQQILCDYQCGR